MSKILIVIVIIIFLHLLGGAVYLLTGGKVFVRMYHDVMGWHLPDYSKGITRDSVNTCAVCKHCGKEIMQDSQGNWF